jgi:hypothetical protein
VKNCIIVYYDGNGHNAKSAQLSDGADLGFYTDPSNDHHVKAELGLGEEDDITAIIEVPTQNNWYTPQVGIGGLIVPIEWPPR